MLLRLLTIGLIGLSTIVAGAPTLSESKQGTLCPSLPVQLELRTSPTLQNRYQLVFASIDPQTQSTKQADYVDIHYRVNNEDSVNLRVQTKKALVAETSESAKQGEVDGILLNEGDVIRAYATYFAKGYACDTPVHTFNAPASQEEVEFVKPTKMNTQAVRRQSLLLNDYRDLNDYRTVNSLPVLRNVRRQDMYDVSDMQTMDVCPSIPLDQDIVKIAGLDNTYMLTFENKDPKQQLSYVDLHLSTDAAKGWDNLRLASDMQLTLAHKVLQTGITIKPQEQLKWYWSYRSLNPVTGQAVDCTTDVSQIAPHQVTHEISMAQLNALANN